MQIHLLQNQLMSMPSKMLMPGKISLGFFRRRKGTRMWCAVGFYLIKCYNWGHCSLFCHHHWILNWQWKSGKFQNIFTDFISHSHISLLNIYICQNLAKIGNFSTKHVCEIVTTLLLCMSIKIIYYIFIMYNNQKVLSFLE